MCEIEDKWIPELLKAANRAHRTKPYTLSLDKWDMVNDAFISIQRQGLPESTPEEHIGYSAWLAVCNCLKDRFKHSSKTFNKSLVYLNTDSEKWDAIADTEPCKKEPLRLDDSEFVSYIWDTAPLNDKERACLYFRYIEDMDWDDVAQRTGLANWNSASSIASMACKKVKEQLQDQYVM